MVTLRIVIALFPASMISIGLETFEKVVVLLDFSIIQMLAVLELIVCSSLSSLSSVLLLYAFQRVKFAKNGKLGVLTST
jgi:hypothetical protein